MQPIRVARTLTQADEWVLVLTAAGIPHAVAVDGTSWTVLVAADAAARAQAALAAYDEESRETAPAPAEPRPYPWMSGVTLGLVLLAFFAMTGPPAVGPRWFERGAAAAGRVVGGEPWRAVTALTLHADALHVAGNAVATAVLVPPLVQRLGGGAALCLVLLAGAAGNVLATLGHEAAHGAVGASTATFGALGSLAALRLLPGGPAGRSRKRWTVPATALLLLVMLGTGRNTDIIAHATGLLAGAALGLAAGSGLRRPPGPAVQWALGVLAALAVVACWALALAPPA
jgi:membrane associated rhomboid family serine protease